MKNIITIAMLSFIYSQDDHIQTIYATSYTNWIYYSFESHAVVECNSDGSTCEGDYDWDIAFQRKHMRTNSGFSGNGNGGAHVNTSQLWTNEWGNINSLPDDIFWQEDTLMNDFYDIITHTYIEGVKNPALNYWGFFQSQILYPTNYVMFVKAANGQDVVKFWAYDYYDNRLGGVISFRYQTGFSQNDENLMGDLNEDGIININDIVMIINMILSYDDLNSFSDMNDDNITDILDVIMIVNIILTN